MRTVVARRRRWLRYPLIGLALLALWLLLWESLSSGALLIGIALAVAGSAVLATLDMPRASLRRLVPLPGLLWDVAAEVVRSNDAVARIILTREGGQARRSGFVEVSLDMRSPHGLAALACILTATPGTVWVDHDPDSGLMLLHVLDLVDEATWVRTVKEKWEWRLREIFE